jgi:hypothetical protein
MSEEFKSADDSTEETTPTLSKRSRRVGRKKWLEILVLIEIQTGGVMEIPNAENPSKVPELGKLHYPLNQAEISKPHVS